MYCCFSRSASSRYRYGHRGSSAWPRAPGGLRAPPHGSRPRHGFGLPLRSCGQAASEGLWGAGWERAARPGGLCGGWYLLLRKLQLAPLRPQHLGDLREGQVGMLCADLLAPLVQEAHVARHRGFGAVGKDLLPLLALGPAPLLHRLAPSVGKGTPASGIEGERDPPSPSGVKGEGTPPSGIRAQMPLRWQDTGAACRPAWTSRPSREGLGPPRATAAATGSPRCCRATRGTRAPELTSSSPCGFSPLVRADSPFSCLMATRKFPC